MPANTECAVSTGSSVSQKEQGNDTGDGIELVGFSVVLVSSLNNPSIVNPDFLRHNNIVESGRQLQDDPISTPFYARVTFEGGLAVKAEPNRVIFEQDRESLTTKTITCPAMAKRYLETVPHVPYTAVGINPKGYRRSPSEAPEKVSTAFRDKGTWMSFKDVCPAIQLRATYRYEQRIIALDVAEAKNQEENAPAIHGILFQANIHRDISARNQQERIEKMAKILQSWEEDLSDFFTLSKRFHFEEHA